MKKKVLSIVLAVVMIMGMIPLSAITAFAAITPGHDIPALVSDESGTYHITSAEDWTKFGNMVTDGSNTFKDKTVVLEADITVEEKIGQWANDNTKRIFAGTFDGGGHSIKLASTTAYDNNALFSFTDGATIKNLTVTGTVNGKSGAAGIVSHAENTTISGCINQATVSGTYYVGGICGYADTVTILNCINDGNISGAHFVGGILGDTATGEAHLNDKMEILNCINYGDITETADKDEGNIGGIVGRVAYCGTVENCFTSGKVTLLNDGDGGIVVGWGNRKFTCENIYYDNTVSENSGLPALVLGSDFPATATTPTASEVAGRADETMLNAMNTKALEHNDWYRWIVKDNKAWLAPCITVSAKTASCTEAGWAQHYKLNNKLYEDEECKTEIPDLTQWSGYTPATGMHTDANRDGRCDGCGIFAETISFIESDTAESEHFTLTDDDYDEDGWYAGDCYTLTVTGKTGVLIRSIEAVIGFGGDVYGGVGISGGDKTEKEGVEDGSHVHITGINEYAFSFTGGSDCVQFGDITVFYENHTHSLTEILKKTVTEKEHGISDTHYYCDGCGMYFSDSNAENRITKETAQSYIIHNWSSDWSSDCYGHYHTCTCEGCTAKATTEAHTGYSTDGVCDECGYTGIFAETIRFIESNTAESEHFTLTANDYDEDGWYAGGGHTLTVTGKNDELIRSVEAVIGSCGYSYGAVGVSGGDKTEKEGVEDGSHVHVTGINGRDFSFTGGSDWVQFGDITVFYENHTHSLTEILKKTVTEKKHGISTTYYYCEKCGNYFSDPNAENRITKETVQSYIIHNWSSDWSSDCYGHYHACTCTGCDAKATTEAHTGYSVDGVCDECGYTGVFAETIRFKPSDTAESERFTLTADDYDECGWYAGGGYTLTVTGKNDELIRSVEAVIGFGGYSYGAVGVSGGDKTEKEGVEDGSHVHVTGINGRDFSFTGGSDWVQLGDITVFFEITINPENAKSQAIRAIQNTVDHSEDAVLKLLEKNAVDAIQSAETVAEVLAAREYWMTAIYKQLGTATHTHTFADTYSHNDTHHWRVCTCEDADCEGLVSGFGEHTFGEGVKEGNKTTYICECGYKKVVYDKTGDNEGEVISGISYTGISLTLGSDISINFYMDLTDEAIKKGKMTFDIGGRVVTLKGTDVKYNETEKKYYFSTPLTVLEMAETVTATFSYNGIDYVENYSVFDYIAEIVNNEAKYGKEAVALAKKIANYGYYAQIYLASIHTNVKIVESGEGYDEMIDLWKDNISVAAAKEALANYSVQVTGTSSNISLYGSTVYFDSATALNYYVTVKNGVMPTAKAVNTKTGKEKYVEVKLYKDNIYIVSVKDITATELSDDITVTINGEITFSGSVFAYCNSVVKAHSFDGATEKDTFAVNAMAAFFEYYKAACDYAESLIPTHTVTFYMDAHCESIDVKVKHGKTVARPDSDPYDTGFVFDGWYKDDTFETPWDFDTPITDNTTIYAKWVSNEDFQNIVMNAKSEVSDMAYDAISKIISLKLEEDIKEIFITEVNNAKSSANSGIENVKYTTDIKKIIVKAANKINTVLNNAKEAARVEYTVSFEMMGHGELVSSQTVEDGGKVTRPADPTADGFKFGGWYKDKNYTEKWNFDTDTVTENTILYAKWTENGQMLEDGYYLVGILGGENIWEVSALTSDMKLDANVAVPGEYKINWTFRENDEIKVAKVDNGLITAWYPTGEANYKIEESDSGNRTLYFHPNGNPKWSCYYFTLE